MADELNITKKQFLEFVARADERLDAMELGKADKVSAVTISIPVSAWIENTDTTTVAAGFAFYADAAVEGLTAKDAAETTLDYASLSIAKACGMSKTATTMAGKIRYYAAVKPTAAMTAQVTIHRGKTTNT